MPISVRVDPKTQRVIERIARKRLQTKSEVIRDAIGAWARQLEESEQAGRPFDRIRDLVGCIRGGPTELSVKTGQKFRELLTAKRRRT